MLQLAGCRIRSAQSATTEGIRSGLFEIAIFHYMLALSRCVQRLNRACNLSTGLFFGRTQSEGANLALSSISALGVFLLLNFAAASSGAFFRPDLWYANLRKPSWTPPNWAFPIVWSVLFCAIAVSGWLVWEAAGLSAWPALVLYALHLLVNAAWSFLFFGLKRLDWAMIEVICLWAMIVMVLVAFYPFSALAALLLVPYLAWVTIAALLNFRLLQLNGPRGATATQTAGR